ncbi:hypothetical protein ERO13_A11G184600v2 [Gossypium hirsutum]|uniref:Uncharacterized protein LOC107896047 isoform X5 n=4 Tax=Gossypium TaxID=3633 RepID=A0A1U8IEX0_GOSHI|nr:uncharacterized protein LOC107896047 isoform X2 [Gossypium hirsutum]XP_040972606.1 uncharacterized protein LOC121203052 isoform X4 [Gossypium hirsutum]KAG4175413.1 hypothetical protein ERO13_A11G184600v2 [Gossypium hirsutum]
MICPRGIEMDSATVHEEIDSLFESTPPLKDSAKIIDKLNQVIQFDSPSGEGKGRKVEELLKRCPNLKKIIIFRVISKAKPHKECQVYSSGSSQSAQFANSWKRIVTDWFAMAVLNLSRIFYYLDTLLANLYLYLMLRFGGKMPT